MSATSEVHGGIEWFDVSNGTGDEGAEAQCARCGSSAEWVRCWNCGGEGVSHHDCGEDTCCCLHPEDNVRCDWCEGAGGSTHCVSSPKWCEANPVSGREHITSTALRAEAWSD
jgi:hypothetical protein